MSEVEQPCLTVAAVARRLGVAPATLRSWERRYGLGPSDRVAGARRRYAAADLARLERMRRLTLDGVAPAEAARLALAGPAAVPAPEPRRPDPADPAGSAAVPAGPARVRALARAAHALDAPAIRESVGVALAEYGVLPTWERLLCPVLRGLGERWAATGDGVEVEHLLAECVTGCLRSVADAVPDSVVARPVLLACPDGETHSLPLYALHAALAERGVASRVLGAGMPAAAVAAAVRRTGPAALFVFAQTAAAASAAAFDGLAPTRPPTALLAGGPGWEPGRLPPRVRYAHDLGEAVHLVQLACGVS